MATWGKMYPAIHKFRKMLQVVVIFLSVLILLFVRFVAPIFVVNHQPQILWRISVDLTVSLICVFIFACAKFAEYAKDESPLEWMETINYIYLTTHLVAILVSHAQTPATGFPTALVVAAALYYYPTVSILHDFMIPFLVQTGIAQSTLRLMRPMELVATFAWVVELMAFAFSFYMYFSTLPSSEITVTFERAFCLGMMPWLYDGSFNTPETFLLNRRITKPMIEGVRPYQVIVDSYQKRLTQ